MEQEIKLALLDAIDLKRKSVKRAMTGAKPAFQELYQHELAVLVKAENYINAAK